MSGRVLIVCGLAAEARIAAGEGVVTVAAPPAALPERLRALDLTDLQAVVSFGLCGGLGPALQAGDLILASEVVDAATAYPCDLAASERLAERLGAERLGKEIGEGGVTVHRGRVATAGAPVLTVADKRRLADASQAIAVDTESRLAARFAKRHNLPFLVLRAVSDTADRPLPPLAVRAIGPSGRLDGRAILAELAARPGQLLLLPRLAPDTARAMATLRRVRRLLGAGLGLFG